MTQIELVSCVVFHEVGPDDKFSPSNQLIFKEEGEDEPELGFKRGDQVISLKAMTHGSPGHTAHALNNLMRALGVPMMSNRFDRDNYLDVQWSRVGKGKERLLEKSPKEAWVVGIPYDFSSATHAPANYLCENCPPGASTVRPLQDVFWRRWLSMGHNNKLSDSDAILLSLVYTDNCKAREQSGFPYEI
ncbi:zinc metalloproteinase nas-14-like isoform X2 [Leguminivora glycinivorella]|uniref:zinc metalloproteinase nas-14-like isoform X2 n=1 Tax=Leguminivora glycinivorella TaxID=1035111 RepID=UPI00200EFCD0|nr:zinc metalloproteinase nas-14-like isoform X2 [Leguminivora glycinivorella]